MTFEGISVINGIRFQVFDVLHEGDCLFEAFSYALLESTSAAAQLRRECVLQMESMWDTLGMDTDDGSFKPYESYASYATSMGKNGTYAGPAEIQALAILYNCRVRIFQGDHLFDTSNPGGLEQVDLLFIREGVHYKCLEEVFEESPPENIVIDNSVDEDVHFAFPEVNYDWHAPRPLFDVLPHNYEDDMFVDDLPTSFPIFSSLRRVHPTREPPAVMNKRSTLKLCSTIGDHFQWACLYNGDTVHGVRQVSMGPFTSSCSDCNATFWEAERLVADQDTPAWCCGREMKTGLANSACFKKISDPIIREWYTGNSPDAMEFQEHIREYNHALSIAVPVTNYSSRNLRTGRVLCLNGRVTFECDASVTSDLQMGQLYFASMSRDITTERVLRSEQRLQSHILDRLERYLRHHNDLVRTFELAGRLQDSHPTSRVTLAINPHSSGFRITDREFIDTDRTAHRPTGSNFIAAVYIGNRLNYNYDVALFPRGGDAVPVFTVHEMSPSLDTMLYPLIHLHAEDPWVDLIVPRNRPTRPRLEHQSLQCGTLRDYYSSRIMMRPDDRGILFQSRTLFQQWLVDAATKIEDNNLNYAENQNEELQVCQLDSLKRFVESEAEEQGKRPGRVVIIPKNIQTSERNMYNSYMDSICISMNTAPPSLLLTFTTNPRWAEILEILQKRGLGSDEYVNAADAVVRTYLGRLGICLGDVFHRGVLGRVLGYSGVHEFTSTFLPHFHCAVILDPADVPRTPEEVDAFVTAEIPSKEDDTDGFYYVMTHMIHRPCDGSSPGFTNPMCRPNGVPCTSGFPFAFRDRTLVTNRGPLLRRRETAPVYSEKWKCMVDNRWVIPCNIRLGIRHGNHLNIMLCGENLCYKYLYGYFTKESRGQCVQGGMLKYFNEQNDGNEMNWDEISHFKDLRVIGPYEAVFKILGVPIVKMSHKVEALPVHLPGKEYQYYRGNPRTAFENPKSSKLLQWFELNTRDPAANQLFYAEVVNSYRWEKGDWVTKTRGNTLGRLMHVNPSPRNMELFFLRLLLLNRPGMKSFEDILTVNGTLHPTFRSACQAMGLDDSESMDYSSALLEVATHGAPYQIRAFFATIVAACSANDPEPLWIQYRDAMSDDYLRSGCGRREAIIRARRDVLKRMEEILGNVPATVQIPEHESDESCPVFNEIGNIQFGVPVRDDSSCDEDGEPGDDEYLDDIPRQARQQDGVDADVNYGVLFDDYYSKYTTEQLLVHDTVMETVENNNNSRNNFFSLVAPAGCGKTFLYQGLALDCRRKGIPFVSSAMTALAALLLDSGDTCHKTFGIPIRARQDGNDRSFIEGCSPEAETLRSAKLILIDEVSMMSKWQVTLIDHLLRDLMNNRSFVFGGKVVILGGDMGQILPVLRNASTSEIIANSMPRWEHWADRNEMKLTRNMRAEHDLEFADWIMTVRDGSANIPGTDYIRVPNYMLVGASRSTTGVTEADQRSVYATTRDEYNAACVLVEKVYPDTTVNTLRTGIIVTPTNAETRFNNNIVVQRIAGMDSNYVAKTSVVYQDVGRLNNLQPGEFLMTTEELEKLQAANLPPHHLKLKVGCVVMLLINLDKKNGLCNGARFLVKQMSTHAIVLEKLNPSHGGESVFFLPRMRMRSDDVPIAGCIERFQFPITLAFAVTINKSQGQSFERVGLFLRRPVFSHGQFYVAVGRAKRKKDVSIVVMRGPLQGSKDKGGDLRKVDVRTKNIVHRDLLR